MELSEKERLSANREYFEAGCLCIHTGSIQKLKSTVDDISAVAYYEKACHCSRNYIEVCQEHNL